MADIWVTSDTHFSHENILGFETDGKSRSNTFRSVNHMDRELVDRWNSVVKPGDKIYHLGDVFFGDKDRFKRLWPLLNGKKRLIVGNHDDVKFLSQGNFFEKVYMWRLFKEHNMVLTHVPIHNSSFRKVEYNVHGHIHFQKSPSPQHVCVCVEHTNYTPVHIEEVLRGK